jgi:hypothetical protein
MSAVPFDTHAFVKRLQGAGFTEEQAEVIADIQRESGAAYAEQVKHDFHLDDIATRRDLDARIKETELKIELARADLGRDIEKAKSELIRWVVAAGVLQTSLIAGMLMKVAKLI